MELNIEAIIGSYAAITLFLLMLTIGLREGFKNLVALWLRPWLLIRSLIASFILVPLVGMVLYAVIPMETSIASAIAAMAICPGAPMLYRKLVTMKADTALAGSFQVTTSLFAILFVPLWIVILNALYGSQDLGSVAVVAKQVATIQLIPIVLGLLVREWLPELADDLLEPVVKISSLMLLGALLIVLIVVLPNLIKVGILNMVAIVLFIAATIVIGHVLGGPDPRTRISLALANSTRNAGLALALIALNSKDNGLVLGAIGAIALLSFVAGAVYVNLYRKQLGIAHTQSANP